MRISQAYFTPEAYILVSEDKVHVDHYIRHAAQWILTDFQDLDQQLPLTSIQSELPSNPNSRYKRYTKTFRSESNTNT